MTPARSDRTAADRLLAVATPAFGLAALGGGLLCLPTATRHAGAALVVLAAGLLVFVAGMIVAAMQHPGEPRRLRALPVLLLAVAAACASLGLLAGIAAGTSRTAGYVWHHGQDVSVTTTRRAQRLSQRGADRRVYRDSAWTAGGRSRTGRLETGLSAPARDGAGRIAARAAGGRAYTRDAVDGGPAPVYRYGRLPAGRLALALPVGLLAGLVLARSSWWR
ncbi:hypothetical protein DPM19_25100 [Actinomadura craniellae]|uniref:Uncharacterized protein n=1 Tax=Actinomadura craniellae TaxID=2231787 RepID=A0A365H038_9ACTN|nr:hypothetical protein [Actinomadura craniellae]RAY12427.1 hypothetical protein DPM19_25100 [Actinomadura craniellae]